jgi:YbgC/YbaW family acyl-CoA thioester hydrolase
MPAFEYTVPVRFHEVDSAGIVFFARIFEYHHDAYEAWIRSIGWPLDPSIWERGYGLPLVHAEADFSAPIRLGQEVRIHLRPTSVGTKSMTVRSELRSAGGELFAIVTTIHCCVDPNVEKPVPLPEDLRKAIAAYLPPA